MFGSHSFKLAISGGIFSAVVLSGSLFLVGEAWARRTPPDAVDSSVIPAIQLAELPPQGREVYGLILQGGPFRYDKDGIVFGNRERLLPAYRRGYYREYTVKMPSSRDRGPRRIICGGEPQRPDACYYTEDHYGSFRKVAP